MAILILSFFYSKHLLLKMQIMFSHSNSNRIYHKRLFFQWRYFRLWTKLSSSLDPSSSPFLSRKLIREKESYWFSSVINISFWAAWILTRSIFEVIISIRFWHLKTLLAPFLPPKPLYLHYCFRQRQKNFISTFKMKNRITQNWLQVERKAKEKQHFTLD